MKLYVLCEAVRNRECGGLCVEVQGPEQLHQGGARKEGGCRGTHGGVSTIIFSGMVGLLFSIGFLFF